MEIQINDIRKESDFRGKTFSNFKKTEVIKTLINNIKDAKVEESIYMSGELILHHIVVSSNSSISFRFFSYFWLFLPDMALLSVITIHSREPVN